MDCILPWISTNMLFHGNLAYFPRKLIAKTNGTQVAIESEGGMLDNTIGALNNLGLCPAGTRSGREQ